MKEAPFIVNNRQLKRLVSSFELLIPRPLFHDMKYLPHTVEQSEAVNTRL